MVQRVSDFNWPTRVEKSFLFYLFQIIKLCQIAIIALFKGLEDIFSKMPLLPLSSTNNTLLDKNDLAIFLVAPQNFFFPHVIG